MADGSSLAKLTDMLLARNGLRVTGGTEQQAMPDISMAKVSKEVQDSSPGLANFSRKIAIVQHLEKHDDTPEWLHSVMGVIYPGSLGLDEGIGHLAMKTFT